MDIPEVTKDWKAQVGLLILVCTVTSVLVLLLDFKIKRDLIAEADKFRIMIDTAGPNHGSKEARGVPSRVGVSANPHASFASGFRGSPVVADNAGMETESPNGSFPESLYGSSEWTVVSGD